MKIDLDIDAELMESVMKATGESTKNGAMNAALSEYLRQNRIFDWIADRGNKSPEDYTAEDRRADEELREVLDSLWSEIEKGRAKPPRVRDRILADFE